MKTKTTLEKAKGKVMTDFAISCGDQMVLVFGNEYVCLEVDRGYESGDEEIIECDLDVFDFGDKLLINAGIVSEEEMTEERKVRVATGRARRQAEERAEYDRLRKKFES